MKGVDNSLVNISQNIKKRGYTGVQHIKLTYNG